jgi:hypothetical protein
MKTILTFLLLSGLIVNAQEKSRLDQVIAKRDALLVEIYEAVKSGAKSGTNDPTQVRAAALELYAFRRDTAKTLPERIRWQEQIVEMENAVAKDVKGRAAIGVMLPLDITRAEERALAAEQKLLELQQTK